MFCVYALMHLSSEGKSMNSFVFVRVVHSFSSRIFLKHTFNTQIYQCKEMDKIVEAIL